METGKTRALDPPSPGSKVDTLVPLPGSVLGAATIVAAHERSGGRWGSTIPVGFRAESLQKEIDERPYLRRHVASG